MHPPSSTVVPLSPLPPPLSQGMEETFSIMVGGPRNYYSFELFLEMRAEDEVFKPYNRGGQFNPLLTVLLTL